MTKYRKNHFGFYFEIIIDNSHGVYCSRKLYNLIFERLNCTKTIIIRSRWYIGAFWAQKIVLVVTYTCDTCTHYTVRYKRPPWSDRSNSKHIFVSRASLQSIWPEISFSGMAGNDSRNTCMRVWECMCICVCECVCVWRRVSFNIYYTQ